MSSNFYTFISSFFDIIIYMLFMSSLLNIKKMNIKRIPFFLIFIILQSFCCFVPYISNFEPIIFVLQTLSMIIPAYFYFNIDLKKIIVNTLITYCFIFLIQFTFAFASTMINPSASNDVFIISGNVYTLLFTLLLIQFVNFNKINIALFNKNKIGYIILVNIVMIAIITSFYFKINYNSFIDLAVYFCFAIILLIIVNIILFNQSFTISRKDDQINAYNQYIPMLNELILSVRAKQHNHINEIQAIIGLLYTHKDYDSLVEAMSNTLDSALESDEPEYLLKLNLLLVSGFLYQKHHYAIKQGKNILFDFKTYDLHTSVPEYELIKMFGILIDNALEAIPVGNSISIFVDSKNNKIEFTTRNAGWRLTQKDYSNFFENGYSKKPEYCESKNHSGLGLYYLRHTILNKYKGDISLWNEGTDILLKICI